MNVSVTTFQPLFEGVKQYVVPLFQRSYTWTEKHWKTLWENCILPHIWDNPIIDVDGMTVKWFEHFYEGKR